MEMENKQPDNEIRERILRKWKESGLLDKLIDNELSDAMENPFKHTIKVIAKTLTNKVV